MRRGCVARSCVGLYGPYVVILAEMIQAAGRWVRRHKILSGLLVGILAVGLTWTVIAAHVLIVDEEPDGPQAVFVLGEHPDRIDRGIEVFHEQGADVLVLTLFKPEPWAVDLVRDGGVPDSSIRVPLTVASTEDEAGVARDMVERCGWRTIAVVTSPYHTRRTGILFARAVGDAANVQVVRAATQVSRWTWWSSKRQRRDVVAEWAKLSRDMVGSTLNRPVRFPTDAPC